MKTIEDRLDEAVNNERNASLPVLHLIIELMTTDYHLKRGSSSVLTYLVKRYRYSGAAAQRRIQAARFLQIFPEVEDKLSAGIVNLTTLAKAMSAVRKVERKHGQLTTQQKAEVLASIENKTDEETDAVLDQTFERPDQVNLTISRKTFEELKAAQERLSHILPLADFDEVIAHLAKNAGPKKFGIKKFIFERDNGSCQVPHPETKEPCGSRYQIEIDHIKPKALGGSDAAENLRCVCRAHNQHRAKQTFGH